MKSAVQAELTIPRQTRYLLPIELGRIERHVSITLSMFSVELMRLQVYDHNFEQALLELGLDARGVAVSENWEVDTTVLRSWLRKLRGICTHPQVGQLQNQADKLHKPGVLKSIGEVLEVSCGFLVQLHRADLMQDMRDKSWRNLMEDWRNKVCTHESFTSHRVAECIMTGPNLDFNGSA